jgi:hypothetical protein
MQNRSFTLPSFILGLSLIISSFIFASSYYEAQKVQKRTLKVVGSATQKFDSDIVKWDLTLNRWIVWNNLKDGYKLLAVDKANFLNFLSSKNFDIKDIKLQPVQSYATYNKENLISGYNLSQQITITTDKIDLVESIALEPSELAQRDINFQYSNLSYFYSKIDELKKSLLSSASDNAKERALEIIKNSDVKLGKLISAKSGVFQITRKLSTETESYGVYDTSNREKEIKVTLHSLFELD